MARNAEKAMTTLARWRQAQLGEDDGNKQRRRPYLASECDNLKEAERWRLEIIREISKKVTQIQNAGLGEFRIRDLNDQINKLLREKRHWEFRCAELGGINYRKRFGPKFELAGREAIGSRGYRYFGAAKDLPGVRELFATEPPLLARKTRAELMKGIDFDYYGYRDEDDGVIVPLEQKAQLKAMHDMLEEQGLPEDKIANEIQRIFEQEEREQEAAEQLLSSSNLSLDGEDLRSFISYVPNVPSPAAIQAEMLRLAKQQLLVKYSVEEKQQQQYQEQQGVADE